MYNLSLCIYILLCSFPIYLDIYDATLHVYILFFSFSPYLYLTSRLEEDGGRRGGVVGTEPWMTRQRSLS